MTGGRPTKTAKGKVRRAAKVAMETARRTNNQEYSSVLKPLANRLHQRINCRLRFLGLSSTAVTNGISN